LRAHRFETHDEIVGQIGTISPYHPKLCLAVLNQVATRCCASTPLVDGQQAAMIAVVQGFEAQAREFRRAVDEIDHSRRMLNFSA
jgi:hypothetical protein